MNASSLRAYYFPWIPTSNDASAECAICLDELGSSLIEEDPAKIPVAHNDPGSVNANGDKHPFHYDCLKDHSRGHYRRLHENADSSPSFIIQQLPCPFCKRKIIDAAAYPNNEEVAKVCKVSTRVVDLTSALLSAPKPGKENPVAAVLKAKASEEDQTAASALTEWIISEMRAQRHGGIPPRGARVYLVRQENANLPAVRSEPIIEYTEFQKIYLLAMFVSAGALVALAVNFFSLRCILKQKTPLLFALDAVSLLVFSILFKLAQRREIPLSFSMHAYIGMFGMLLPSYLKTFSAARLTNRDLAAKYALILAVTLYRGISTIQYAGYMKGLKITLLRSLTMTVSVLAGGSLLTLIGNAGFQSVFYTTQLLRSFVTKAIRNRAFSDSFACKGTVGLSIFLLGLSLMRIYINKIAGQIPFATIESKKEEIITIVASIALLAFSHTLGFPPLQDYLNRKFYNLNKASQVIWIVSLVPFTLKVFF